MGTKTPEDQSPDALPETKRYYEPQTHRDVERNSESLESPRIPRRGSGVSGSSAETDSQRTNSIRDEDRDDGKWNWGPFKSIIPVKRSHETSKISDVVSAQRYQEVSCKLLEAEGTVREQQTQILELTKTITHLNRRDGETSKDDGYFSGKFTAIADAIVQWVLTHFRTADRDSVYADLESIVDAGLLSPGTKKLVEPYKETELFLTRPGRLRVIGSIVADFLHSQIFECCLFGAIGGGEEIIAMVDQLHGTDLQIQRWRSLTTRLYIDTSSFKIRFTTQVGEIVNSLGKLLSGLAPQEADDLHRSTELRKLVNSAALLSLEVRGQSDLIQLCRVERGILYEAHRMEDMNCEYEEDELEENGAIVELQLFPAVMRKGFDPDGNFWAQAELLKKANVLTSVDIE